MSKNVAQEYAESVGRGFWEAYEAGHVFGLVEEATCRECGNSYDPANNEPCPSGHGDDDPHLPEGEEAASAYDYLSDVLDIDYIVNGDGEYRGAEVMLTCGGPTVWIDTRERALYVSWGGRAQWALPDEMIRELDDALAEMWTPGAR